MSHIKSSMLTRGSVVGKGCDLEGNSRLLRDLAVQAALSRALVPHRLLVFGGSTHAWSLGWAAWPAIGPQLPQL